MLRKPYFLARTTGNMELVWKKNNGPQYPKIHASVALLAIYSTYRCIRCTLGWFFFSGKVSDIFNLGVRSLVPSPELSTFEMFWSANQNKQLPSHGANLESHDARLVFMTGNTKKKEYLSIRDEKNSDMKESTKKKKVQLPQDLFGTPVWLQ